MPDVLLREAFPRKHMAQMPAAVRAENLGAVAVRVRCPPDGAFNLIIKGGPAAMGVKLVFRAVQGRLTLPAHIVAAGFKMVGVLAGKGGLGALVQDDLLLVRRQLVVWRHFAGRCS